MGSDGAAAHSKLTRFVTPREQGMILRLPAGISLKVSMRGRDIRVEHAAAGPVAELINADLQAFAAGAGRPQNGNQVK